MKTFRHIIPAMLAAACAIFQADAKAPNSYYTSCEGKSGKALLSQLEDVVGDHTTVSYNGLWDLFETSDVRPDGTVWDMYSTAVFYPGKKQCGNYKKIGDCYNREHSFPKSWFNDAKPMYSDAYHLYPTDGYVNGQRSNLPFGECANGQYAESNGSNRALGKKGKSTFSGYSGTVFEPDDEYKGDFARSYFYMAAAYNSRIANWDSDMLAGNSYPAFSSWAVNLLLKWHRLDPVSQKEIDRNEVVYGRQKNRNPFIDHPELAEHIWGDKKNVGWQSGSAAEASLNQPVDGSSLALPSTIVGVASTATVSILGSNLQSDVTVSVAGSGFSVSPATVSKASAMSGASVTVSYLAEKEGKASGTLTVASGSAKATVSLSCEAIGTLPVGPVNTVGTESFVATWSYVGDDESGKYTLDVKQAGQSLSGYPRKVDAKAGYYRVEDLEPSTTYAYTVSSAHLSSTSLSVTTNAPVPAVTLLFDGDLHFTSTPGEPSEAAELLMVVENITDNISLKVNDPFQLSSDKASWATSLTLSPEEDRFYLRMLSHTAGSFDGTIKITAGAYTNDETEFTGTVLSSTSSAFLEDFEADASAMGNYSTKSYQGSACLWNIADAGMWATDKPHGGEQVLRMGKSATSTLEMAEDHAAGFGTVTLWTMNWSNDAAPSYELEYSTDGGSSWTTAGTGKPSSSVYSQQTFTVNVPGPARIRVRQTEGKRFMIDDIEATGYTTSFYDSEEPDYHRWDAFCRGGQLVVEAYENVDVQVFALDGTTVFNGTVAQGSLSLDLAAGLYIVAVDDFARRVLVK